MTDELRQALETERKEIETRIQALHEERRHIVRRLNAIYELLQLPEAEQKKTEAPEETKA